MNLSLVFRYALRSLGRHRRRTALSILGIGIGCGLCVFVIGFVRGEEGMMIRAAANSGIGHLRVVPDEWAATRDDDLRLNDWRKIQQTAKSHQAVELAAPRAHGDALLGFGVRTTGVEMTGVDPELEIQANRLVQKNIRGRYLEEEDEGVVVIGRTVAERLDAELEDELMVTIAGKDGAMQSAMLQIVGILSTGSRDLDASICHITLHAFTEISQIPGAGELTVLVNDIDKISQIAAELKTRLPAGTTIMTWEELMPELASGIEIDKTWSRLVVIIITLVVFLGIASAQLAAVLERRKEFAVMAAVGMQNMRLLGTMLIEGALLGLTGGILGLALGAPVTWHTARSGIDFSSLYGNMDLTMSNVLIDPVFYPDFGWWVIPLALGLAFLAAMFSAVYPAWYAMRTDPAEALRVEQ